MKLLLSILICIVGITIGTVSDASAQEADSGSSTAKIIDLAKDYLSGNTDLSKHFGSMNFGSIGATDYYGNCLCWKYDNITALQIATIMGIPLHTDGDKEALAVNLLDQMIEHDPLTMEGQARNQQAVYKVVNVIHSIARGISPGENSVNINFSVQHGHWH
jgi:hypothetical protein